VKKEGKIVSFIDSVFVLTGVVFIFLGYVISALITNAGIFAKLISVLIFAKKDKKAK